MRQLHVAAKAWAPLLLLLHTRAEPPPPQSVLGLGWRTSDTAQPAVRRASLCAFTFVLSYQVCMAS